MQVLIFWHKKSEKIDLMSVILYGSEKLSFQDIDPCFRGTGTRYWTVQEKLK